MTTTATMEVINSPSRPTVDRAAIAAQIATVLGETEPTPLAQIRQIVWALGYRQTLFLMHQALAIQAAGGLLTVSGRRPRTTGGIFFWLVYTAGQPKPGRVLKRRVPRRPASEKIA